MFKDHALKIQLMKTNSKKNSTNESVEEQTLDLDKLSAVVKDQAKYLAVVVVASVAAVTALHTASEVIINAAPKR